MSPLVPAAGVFARFLRSRYEEAPLYNGLRLLERANPWVIRPVHEGPFTRGFPHSVDQERYGERCPAGNTETRIDNTNPLLRCQRRCLLPLDTNLCQEIVSWRASFRQNLVAAIAVVADCGSADKSLWRDRQICQRISQ